MQIYFQIEFKNTFKALFGDSFQATYEGLSHVFLRFNSFIILIGLWWKCSEQSPLHDDLDLFLKKERGPGLSRLRWECLFPIIAQLAGLTKIHSSVLFFFCGNLCLFICICLMLDFLQSWGLHFVSVCCNNSPLLVLLKVKKRFT